MVGIINPSKNQTLEDFKKRASALARSVSPGRTSFGGEIADNDDSSNSTSGGNSSSGSGSDKDGKDNGSVSLSVSIGALALAMLMAV